MGHKRRSCAPKTALPRASNSDEWLVAVERLEALTERYPSRCRNGDGSGTSRRKGGPKDVISRIPTKLELSGNKWCTRSTTKKLLHVESKQRDRGNVLPTNLESQWDEMISVDAIFPNSVRIYHLGGLRGFPPAEAHLQAEREQRANEIRGNQSMLPFERLNMFLFGGSSIHIVCNADSAVSADELSTTSDTRTYKAACLDSPRLRRRWSRGSRAAIPSGLDKSGSDFFVYNVLLIGDTTLASESNARLAHTLIESAQKSPRTIETGSPLFAVCTFALPPTYPASALSMYISVKFSFTLTEGESKELRSEINKLLPCELNGTLHGPRLCVYEVCCAVAHRLERRLSIIQTKSMALWDQMTLTIKPSPNEAEHHSLLRARRRFTQSGGRVGSSWPYSKVPSIVASECEQNQGACERNSQSDELSPKLTSNFPENPSPLSSNRRRRTWSAINSGTERVTLKHCTRRCGNVALRWPASKLNGESDSCTGSSITATQKHASPNLASKHVQKVFCSDDRMDDAESGPAGILCGPLVSWGYSQGSKTFNEFDIHLPLYAQGIRTQCRNLRETRSGDVNARQPQASEEKEAGARFSGPVGGQVGRVPKGRRIDAQSAANADRNATVTSRYSKDFIHHNVEALSDALQECLSVATHRIDRRTYFVRHTALMPRPHFRITTLATISDVHLHWQGASYLSSASKLTQIAANPPSVLLNPNSLPGGVKGISCSSLSVPTIEFEGSETVPNVRHEPSSRDVSHSVKSPIISQCNQIVREAYSKFFVELLQHIMNMITRQCRIAHPSVNRIYQAWVQGAHSGLGGIARIVIINLTPRGLDESGTVTDAELMFSLETACETSSPPALCIQQDAHEFSSTLKDWLDSPRNISSSWALFRHVVEALVVFHRERVAAISLTPETIRLSFTSEDDVRVVVGGSNYALLIRREECHFLKHLRSVLKAQFSQVRATPHFRARLALEADAALRAAGCDACSYYLEGTYFDYSQLLLWQESQQLSRADDVKSDLFSLGMLLFELSHPPFNSALARADALRRVSTVYPPPKDLLDPLEPAAISLVLRLLNPDKMARPAAAQILFDDFIGPASINRALMDKFIVRLGEERSPESVYALRCLFRRAASINAASAFLEANSDLQHRPIVGICGTLLVNSENWIVTAPDSRVLSAADRAPEIERRPSPVGTASAEARMDVVTFSLDFELSSIGSQSLALPIFCVEPALCNCGALVLTHVDHGAASACWRRLVRCELYRAQRTSHRKGGMGLSKLSRPVKVKTNSKRTTCNDPVVCSSETFPLFERKASSAPQLAVQTWSSSTTTEKWITTQAHLLPTSLIDDRGSFLFPTTDLITAHAKLFACTIAFSLESTACRVATHRQVFKSSTFFSSSEKVVQRSHSASPVVINEGDFYACGLSFPRRATPLQISGAVRHPRQHFRLLTACTLQPSDSSIEINETCLLEAEHLTHILGALKTTSKLVGGIQIDWSHGDVLLSLIADFAGLYDFERLRMVCCYIMLRGLPWDPLELLYLLYFSSDDLMHHVLSNGLSMPIPKPAEWNLIRGQCDSCCASSLNRCARQMLCLRELILFTCPAVSISLSPALSFELSRCTRRALIERRKCCTWSVSMLSTLIGKGVAYLDENKEQQTFVGLLQQTAVERALTPEIISIENNNQLSNEFLSMKLSYGRILPNLANAIELLRVVDLTLTSSVTELNSDTSAFSTRFHAALPFDSCNFNERGSLVVYLSAAQSGTVFGCGGGYGALVARKIMQLDSQNQKFSSCHTEKNAAKQRRNFAPAAIKDIMKLLNRRAPELIKPLPLNPFCFGVELDLSVISEDLDLGKKKTIELPISDMLGEPPFPSRKADVDHRASNIHNTPRSFCRDRRCEVEQACVGRSSASHELAHLRVSHLCTGSRDCEETTTPALTLESSASFHLGLAAVKLTQKRTVRCLRSSKSSLQKCIAAIVEPYVVLAVQRNYVLLYAVPAKEKITAALGKRCELRVSPVYNVARFKEGLAKARPQVQCLVLVISAKLKNDALNKPLKTSLRFRILPISRKESLSSSVASCSAPVIYSTLELLQLLRIIETRALRAP